MAGIKRYSSENIAIHLAILCLLAIFALLLKGVPIDTSRQSAGWIVFALGFALLGAFAISQVVRIARLPLLSGYILAGILAGPYVFGFLSIDTVERLRLIDELALSFIALAAGAELRLESMRQRGWALVVHIVLISAAVFGVVLLFILLAGSHFNVTAKFSAPQLLAFAMLLGVVAIARSPSSTIALLNECRASGPFSGTILSVTIVTDILIIVLFTIALAVSKSIMAAGGVLQWESVVLLTLTIFASLLLGAVLGKGIAFYIETFGYDLLLFLVFIAFGVYKLSLWCNRLMDTYAHASLHLEPLLICMSAGFVVRNFSRSGAVFAESLDRVSLTVYVLFFALAGASLNFRSLALCWPLALSIVAVRAAGLFGGSWLAGRINHEPPAHCSSAWMTYLTQAGVAIGLAQLAMREFPEIGMHLNTVVLAIIAVNQIIGPILFKGALSYVGEARQM